MKKLIGGIVCVLLGVLFKINGTTLFNIEVNGEKQAISGTLDLVACGALVVVGAALIAAFFFSRKKS